MRQFKNVETQRRCLHTHLCTICAMALEGLAEHLSLIFEEMWWHGSGKRLYGRNVKALAVVVYNFKISRACSYCLRIRQYEL